MIGKLPNPGSDEAIEQGCACPVLDNHHGKGVSLIGKPLFWVNEECPLHGSPSKRRKANALWEKR
jgi:hypothetical protein